MAPEQLEGKDADTRTDIFAFGTTVYEAEPTAGHLVLQEPHLHGDNVEIGMLLSEGRV